MTATNSAPSALRNIGIHVALLGLSMGIMIPTQPQLVKEIIGDLSSSSMHFGVITAAASFVQFLSQPFIGALSDSLRTRRKILLVQSTGLMVVFVLLALISKYKYTLKWFIFAKFLQALVGNCYNTAFASVSDITSGEERSKAYGRLGMSFGLGFVVGPILAGILSS